MKKKITANLRHLLTSYSDRNNQSSQGPPVPSKFNKTQLMDEKNPPAEKSNLSSLSKQANHATFGKTPQPQPAPGQRPQDHPA